MSTEQIKKVFSDPVDYSIDSTRTRGEDVLRTQFTVSESAGEEWTNTFDSTDHIENTF